MSENDDQGELQVTEIGEGIESIPQDELSINSEQGEIPTAKDQ